MINGNNSGANGRHLLDHPVFAGGEVVFGGVDEGNPEVEEQVDDQRPRVLRQENLQAGQTAEVRTPVSRQIKSTRRQSKPTVTQLIWAPRSLK